MKRKITVKQILALLIASLLPAALIVLGIIILMGGAIFNFSLAITYFMLPIAVIVGLFFCDNIPLEYMGKVLCKLYLDITWFVRVYSSYDVWLF